MSRFRQIVPILAGSALLGLTTCGRDPGGPASTAPPVIASIVPTNGSLVSGTATIQVGALDAAWVALDVDETPVASTNRSPFRLAWNSSVSLNGAHRARVTAGNARGEVDSTIILFSNNPGQGIAVVATESEATVPLGTTHQFEAFVLGTSNVRVAWSIQGSTGGATSLGTISEDGLYHAPSVAPSPPLVGLVARSVADPQKAAYVTVHLSGVSIEPVSVTVLPESIDVMIGSTYQLEVSVGGAANQAVTWSVDGGRAWGRISPDGLYSAPITVPNPPRTRIEARSVADTLSFDVCQVTITAPTGYVEISPAQVTVPAGLTASFIARVFGQVTQEVAWSVENGPGYGWINAWGVYQAPDTLPAFPYATIRATSLTATLGPGTALVHIGPPISVQVTPDPVEVRANHLRQFAAYVSNTPDQRVYWSVRPEGAGSITETGLYLAPQTVPDPPEVAIVATSAADPRKTGEARVTITENIPGEAEVLTDLSRAGYQSLLVSDQALELAGWILYQAWLLNGNQVTISGTVRQTASGFVYEPDGTPGVLTGVASDLVVRVQVTEIATAFQLFVTGVRASAQSLVGTLRCRVEIPGEMNLTIDHEGWSASEGYMEFGRHVSGTLQSAPIRSLDITHEGRFLEGPHVGFFEHHVSGRASTAALDLAIAEDLTLQVGEFCYQPGGDFTESWAWRTVSSAPTPAGPYSLSAEFRGSAGGGCAHYWRVTRADQWFVSGTLTRDSLPESVLFFSRPPVEGDIDPPGAEIRAGALTLTYRTATFPEIIRYIPNPFR